MQIRYELIINGERHSLQPSDLQNWADVECSYSRSDLGGVIRSFMSKFEFVNNAYDLLINAYSTFGVKTVAQVIMYGMNDNWVYEPLFSCDLDISSLSYTPYVLTISAIDNSVSAKIKANKSTKYEFLLKEDIAVSAPYAFPRLAMIESVTYEITDGYSNPSGDLVGTYYPSHQQRIFMGTVGDEIINGGMVRFNEDQLYEDGYMLEIMKDLTLHIDFYLDASLEYGTVPFDLMVNDTPVLRLHPGLTAVPEFFIADANIYGSQYSSIEELMEAIASNDIASMQWESQNFSGRWAKIGGTVWEVHYDGHKNEFVNTKIGYYEYDSRPYSSSGDVEVKAGDKVWIRFTATQQRSFHYWSSKFVFSWQNQAKSVTINTVKPVDMLSAILRRMDIDYGCEISTSDERFTNGDILLLAAESIREIDNAKIYSSFNDFCNWMEAVFGYSYVINDTEKMVRFLHRSEIFRDTDRPDIVSEVKDLEYSISKDMLYSNIVVGYNKKDYEGVNGRDEFNFSSTYTTDYPLEGKKLELKSPYRADSYGIEFLVQKRGADTTDNQSDNDVFFVSGKMDNGTYLDNSTVEIGNSITGTLRNGQFSPISCVEANACMIATYSPDVDLTFASSEGNADITIDGVRISDNLNLSGSQLFTEGVLKFSSSQSRLPEDINRLIRVQYEGSVYEGYIKDVSVIYAREESTEYTLIVKRKSIC